MEASQRDGLIEKYASAPARLRAAVEAFPAEGIDWRPEPREFSVHEIVCHCADAETNAYARIRYLLTADEPLIIGYDPDVWAARFDYANHPVDVALGTVDAVRANTVPILRGIRDDEWTITGTHTESGAYTVADWLRIYAAHLDEHVEQIANNLAAWRGR